MKTISLFSGAGGMDLGFMKEHIFQRYQLITIRVKKMKKYA